MKLSVFAVILGAVVSGVQLIGLARPAAFGASVRKFPRSLPWGYVLVAAATLWFLYNLSLESVADFAAYKPMMFGGFALVGALVCIFIPDFLSVRGLALILMLLGKLMLDTARWNASPWRLVIVIWAYLMICAGMWFTVSPWRCRDLINWGTATEQRIRLTCGLRLVFGLFVMLLGIMVF